MFIQRKEADSIGYMNPPPYLPELLDSSGKNLLIQSLISVNGITNTILHGLGVVVLFVKTNTSKGGMADST